MANTNIENRSQTGVALDATQYDTAVDSLNLVTEEVTAATQTIAFSDQNKVFQYNRGTAIAVTLPDATAIMAAAIDTSDFKFIAKNIGAGDVTITTTTDELDGATTLVLKQWQSAIIQTNAAGDEWITVALDGPARSVRTWRKGADVASATALPVLPDGNYFDVTGTTTITSIDTVAIGTVIKLHFDGALTLTHNATDLVLPGGANITTVAGDEAEFVEYDTGDWRCTSYLTSTFLTPGLLDEDDMSSDDATRGASQQSIKAYAVCCQKVHTSDNTVTPITSTIPYDNNIPQAGDGDQILSQVITPIAAGNKLLITVDVPVIGNAGSTPDFELCLFCTTDGNDAIAGSVFTFGGSAHTGHASLVYEYDTQASAAARTFTVEAGRTGSGTTYLNRTSGNATFWGGVPAFSITIEEFST